MYEIEIESVFAASHALKLPSGDMEPVHGHNWPVCVTVASNQLDAMDCVMDFHELQHILEHIVEPWRNRHLNEVEPFVSGVNPSAERVAQHIGERVASKLPQGVELVCVSVGEAPGCRAVWRTS